MDRRWFVRGFLIATTNIREVVMNIQPETLRLYAVTDRAWAADEDAFFRQIEAVIDGGA